VDDVAEYVEVASWVGTETKKSPPTIWQRSTTPAAAKTGTAPARTDGWSNQVPRMPGCSVMMAASSPPEPPPTSTTLSTPVKSYPVSKAARICVATAVMAASKTAASPG